MSVYQVTRTIRNKKTGRTYTYTFWQESWREGNKVKTKYRGRGKRPLSFFSRRVPEDQAGWAYIERMMEQYPGGTRERPGGPITDERQQIKAIAEEARHARRTATEIGRFNKSMGFNMKVGEPMVAPMPIEKPPTELATTAPAQSSAPAAADDAPSETPSAEAADPGADSGEAK